MKYMQSLAASPLQPVATATGIRVRDGRRLVTVEFTETDGKTRVAFHIGGFDSIASRDSEVEGWNECLDRLVLHFADARTTSESIR